MKIFTTTLNAPNSVTINEDMGVLQFSIAGATSTSTFTITGGTTLPNFPTKNTSTPSSAVAVQGAYNSQIASTQSKWSGVTITCTVGSVSIVMTQD